MPFDSDDIDKIFDELEKQMNNIIEDKSSINNDNQFIDVQEDESNVYVTIDLGYDPKNVTVKPDTYFSDRKEMIKFLVSISIDGETHNLKVPSKVSKKSKITINNGIVDITMEKV